MDSKNQENYLKKYDEKSLEKLQSRVIFTDQIHLFTFKKTEKIVAAIYLITNLISDIEPIKWQMRKISLGLMSDILMLKRLQSAELRLAVVGLMTTISEIISLLKIASVADHVSAMNYSIVQKELVLLMESLQSMHLETVGNRTSILPQDFFNVPTSIFSHPLSTNSPAIGVSLGFDRQASYKGHKTPFGIKDNHVPSAPKDNIKDNRRENMLKLLRAGKPLGIKDFAREIKDCSEKTIQRELLFMVGNGVLKKTGERRWSLYSLS